MGGIQAPYYAPIPPANCFAKGVVEDEQEDPIEGATVEGDLGSTTTNAAGKFKLRVKCRAKQTDITVLMDGYVSQSLTVKTKRRIKKFGTITLVAVA